MATVPTLSASVVSKATQKNKPKKGGRFTQTRKQYRGGFEEEEEENITPMAEYHNLNDPIYDYAKSYVGPLMNNLFNSYYAKQILEQQDPEDYLDNNSKADL